MIPLPPSLVAAYTALVASDRRFHLPTTPAPGFNELAPVTKDHFESVAARLRQRKGAQRMPAATLSREQHRNLKKQIGDTAADAVGQLRQLVDHISLQHRVLAAQMLDFEHTVAVVKQGRASDFRLNQDRADALSERLENCAALIQILSKNLTSIERTMVASDDELGSRLRRIETMTFWQRVWWNLTGGLPSELDATREPAPTSLGDGV